MNKVEFFSHSVEETNAYAALISGHLKPGDVVLLEGDLGSGKTQFVKACCQALGYEKSVTSPSYTLANIYAATNFSIIHADFYRVKQEQELLDLGLDTYLDSSISFIEWGDRFQDFFTDYLKLTIEYVDEEDSHRKITLTATGNSWIEKFKTIENHLHLNHQL